jgi:NADPH:quinone reductase-like Zn-dependent oxidoreductase
VLSCYATIINGASGGVGSVAVQLAVVRDARIHAELII